MSATDPGGELPVVRRGRVVDYVDSVRQASVHEIADHVEVSVDTVRRDLTTLHKLGLLTRTRGGALANSALTSPDRELRVREQLQEREKEGIGRLAATLVEHGAVLGFNGGTTTLAVARCLTDHRDLTVATNNLSIPFEIPVQSVRNLYVFGGEVRFSSQVTVGSTSFPDTEAGMVHLDVAVIGVGGVAPEGYYVSNLGEASMMRQMVQHSSRVVVVADSTKFSRHQFALVTSLEAADHLVTDAEPPAELRAALEDAGVEVLVVGPSRGRVRSQG
jgi:DeoR/GlpR family transcriptional regulator of sugar metabolism